MPEAPLCCLSFLARLHVHLLLHPPHVLLKQRRDRQAAKPSSIQEPLLPVASSPNPAASAWPGGFWLTQNKHEQTLSTYSCTPCCIYNLEPRFTACFTAWVACKRLGTLSMRAWPCARLCVSVCLRGWAGRRVKVCVRCRQAPCAAQRCQ